LVYAKLPGWFKIPTLIGSYNPNRAVLVEKDDEKKLFLIVGSVSISMQLIGEVEEGKIKCGRGHYT